MSCNIPFSLMLLSGLYRVFKMPGYPTLDNCAIQSLEV